VADVTEELGNVKISITGCQTTQADCRRVLEAKGII